MSEEALLPNMMIDFTPYRLAAGDTIEFITKMNNTQAELETWSKNLGTYGQLINALLEQARDVPEDIRNTILDLVVRAEAAREAMEQVLAGANLPIMVEGSEGKALIVKPDLSGFGFSDLSQVDPGIGDISDLEPTESRQFVTQKEKGMLSAMMALDPSIVFLWAGVAEGECTITVTQSLVGLNSIAFQSANKTDGAVHTRRKYFLTPLAVGESHDLSALYGGDDVRFTLESENTFTLTQLVADISDNVLYSVIGRFNDDLPLPEIKAADVTESAARRFVTDSQINQWDNKANLGHNHAASSITQDSQHRFVSDAEKQAWNTPAPSPVTQLWTGNQTVTGSFEFDLPVSLNDLSVIYIHFKNGMFDTAVLPVNAIGTYFKSTNWGFSFRRVDSTTLELFTEIEITFYVLVGS